MPPSSLYYANFTSLTARGYSDEEALSLARQYSSPLAAMQEQMRRLCSTTLERVSKQVDIRNIQNDYGNYGTNAAVNFTSGNTINGQGIHSGVQSTRFGMFNSSYNGCGWIASYNAMTLMEENVRPADIIDYYEPNLFLGGMFGVSPKNVTSYFQDQGYTANYNSYALNYMQSVDAEVKTSDVLILEYYVEGWVGRHYVAIEENNGTYNIYNEYNNSTQSKGVTSIDQWMADNNHIPYATISVSK